MADAYLPADIESKWQAFWQAKKVFRAIGPGEPGFDPARPKYYVLGMFPYPSGAGLHVGHPLSYTAVDILARYKRAKGYNVLNPIGWDSFGLPAEQYAVKTGFPPAATTLNSINIFRRQLMALGFSYDWERETATSAASYFKWTQWIFLRLFEAGLAYKAQAPVWWCEALGTVLANEEVDDRGLSEIGHHPCIRRPLDQWFLKITAYADKLLGGLESVSWPESIKTMQRNWIGKSTGADLAFTIGGEGVSTTTIWVFTTRPDTVFGATYLVLAPEHPLLDHVVSKAQRQGLNEYRQWALTRSDRIRLSSDEKTGVWTGGYARNPATGGQIPIWVSDYVLMNYGTGAIMAVPAHDERDFDFAVAHELPILPVVEPSHPEDSGIVRQLVRQGKAVTCFIGDGSMVHSAQFDGLSPTEATTQIVGFLGEKGMARESVRYKLRDWLFSRQRYWGEPIPLVHSPTGEVRPVGEEQLPVTLPPLADFRPSGKPEPPLAKVPAWVDVPSLEAGSAPWRRETNVMPQWAGSCWYYLRFTDPHNPSEFVAGEKERYWLPVDMYIGGAEHAVLHLLYSRFWHRFLYEKGYVSCPEPFARLFNQGMIQGLAYQTQAGSYLSPKQVRLEGSKAFHPETGEELREVVVKMSKSIGNVVNPDEIVREYGADTLRLYLMSMGPLEADKPWDSRQIKGVNRFLQRLWRVVVGAEEEASRTPCRPHLLDRERAGGPLLEKLLNRTVYSVTKDIENISFNTAIAHLIVFTNEAVKDPESLSHAQVSRFLQILQPFAPHLAEELWLRIGRTDLLSLFPWPEVAAETLAEAVFDLPVQVNGKLRCVIQVPRGMPAANIFARAKEEPAVKKHLATGEVAKEVYVHERILNFILKA